MTYLIGNTTSLALKGDWSDKSLNTWSNGLGLLAFLLDLSSDNVLSDGVVLVQSKELSDVVCTFWSKTSRYLLVGETFNFAFALFDNDQVENGQVVVDDASTD